MITCAGVTQYAPFGTTAVSASIAVAASACRRREEGGCRTFCMLRATVARAGQRRNARSLTLNRVCQPVALRKLFGSRHGIAILVELRRRRERGSERSTLGTGARRAARRPPLTLRLTVSSASPSSAAATSRTVAGLPLNRLSGATLRGGRSPAACAGGAGLFGFTTVAAARAATASSSDSAGTGRRINSLETLQTVREGGRHRYLRGRPRAAVRGPQRRRDSREEELSRRRLRASAQPAHDQVVRGCAGNAAPEAHAATKESGRASASTTPTLRNGELPRARVLRPPPCLNVPQAAQASGALPTLSAAAPCAAARFAPPARRAPRG